MARQGCTAGKPGGNVNATPDISLISMIFVFVLLLIPLVMSLKLKLGICRELLISAGRMTVQLFLVGIYLGYLFDLNNPFVTVGWLLVMIVFASFSVVRNSDLNRKVFVLPVTGVLLGTTVLILIWFNTLIIRIDNIVDARFVIAVGGMVLGNAMKGIIVGVSDFYRNIKRNENRYLYHLAQGATVFESGSPYLRKSLVAAIRPSMASMATMGIVFLPGMMTGQIIGGSPPMTAIKYQIAIMITIMVSTVASIGMTILLTIRASFDEFGILRKDIFRQ